MSSYYPIGTIVRLTIDDKRLFMIAGYFPKQGNEKTRDYFGVPFPFGLTKENQYILFDSKCITEVVHTGYCDEECQSVLDGFEEFVENINKLASEDFKTV